MAHLLGRIRSVERRRVLLGHNQPLPALLLAAEGERGQCIAVGTDYLCFQCAFLLYLYLPMTLGAQKLYLVRDSLVAAQA